MSLIENDRVGGSEQVAEPVLLQREIRQQQVVVHDDDVRFQGLAPRQHHVTAGDFRTAHAKAALAGGGDLRPHRMGVRQAAHFRQITALRGARPAPDARQHGIGGARARRTRFLQRQLLAALVRAREAVAAQIIGATLEKGYARRPAERRGHERQVLGEQLVLQRARPGRDQHARAAQQRRHQVSEGFAGAGARFHHQGFACGERAGYAFRHEQLFAPHLEIRQRPLEGPAVTENVLKIQHVGKRLRQVATILARVRGVCRDAYLAEFPANWCAARRWTRMASASVLYQGQGSARDILSGPDAPPNKRSYGWLLPHMH